MMHQGHAVMDKKGEEKAKADAAKPETAKGAAKSSKPADKA